MPQLSSSDVVEIQLPSGTPEDPAWVKVDTTLTSEQALEIATNQNKVKAMVAVVAEAIREWNFVDSNGKPVPVTYDNVNHLRPEDFGVIAEKVTDSIDLTFERKNVGSDEKKD